MKVGEIVEVECVRAWWAPGSDNSKKAYWWPVMGSFHTDEALNFVPLHYHMDYRFLTDAQTLKSRVDAFTSMGQKVATACYHAPLMGRLIVPQGVETVNADLCQYRAGDHHYHNQNRDIKAWLAKFPRDSWRRTERRPYLREWPGCPQQSEKLANKLYEEYWDAEIDPVVRICPNRGADLSGIEPDEDGVITCPAHGLRFCATSRKAVWHGPTHFNQEERP